MEHEARSEQNASVPGPRPARGSAIGNLIAIVLCLALIGMGVYLWLGRTPSTPPPLSTPTHEPAAPQPASPKGSAPVPIEPAADTPVLDAPAAYIPKDGILQIDISEYAGYGGLIVANGGMAPNPDSFFAKEYGFKVKITMNENETWSPLNNGRLAAIATTADALAVLGRSFEAIVPVQISYSRGADMVVVDRGIASVNQLAGKVLAASQFNESEFFIRYLAQEASVPVKVLRDLDVRPQPGELGLVFYEDAFVACDAYAHELAATQPRLNGCVGWTPRTDEVVDGSNNAAKVLVSNRNLLVIADVLAVNKGLAKEHPEMARGLVHGILEGNRRLRDQPEAHLPIVAKSFGWTEDETRAELARVHLSNLPENRAFFSGAIDTAGSFSGIFQSSVLAYGDIIRNPTDAARFADISHLDALTQKHLFAEQKIAIAPIRTATTGALEGDPLLSKDIRFFFEPNSAVLDRNAPQNMEFLDTIQRFLQVSPGSTVLLRGHVDNARVDEFRRQGGDQMVKSMALKAMELSRQRALAVSDALKERHKGVDGTRIEAVGRGWEEPAGANSDLNRRVEVQWFTLE
jgi:NitT/TauT family transport system substrate-binding protein